MLLSTIVMATFLLLSFTLSEATSSSGCRCDEERAAAVTGVPRTWFMHINTDGRARGRNVNVGKPPQVVASCRVCRFFSTIFAAAIKHNYARKGDKGVYLFIND